MPGHQRPTWRQYSSYSCPKVRRSVGSSYNTHEGVRCEKEHADIAQQPVMAGGPDVSSEDELGCPTCRGYTWVFAFLLGRRNLCGILFCRGCDFEFSFHAIHTIGLKFTIDKHTKSMVPLRVLSRTNLARFALSTSSISFLSFRLRTLKLSCRSFSHPDPLFSITSALFLQNTRGGCPQHFGAELRFRRHMRHVAPLSPVASVHCAYFLSPRGCTLARPPPLHRSAKMPLCKSFACHSYALRVP